MNSYFTSVLSLTALSAVIGILIPNEKKTGKYVRFILGLLTVLTLFRPFQNTIPNLPDFTKPEITSETVDPREKIVQNAEKLIEEDITKELFTRFRISKDYCTVKVKLNTDDYENITPKSILITLRSYGAWGDKTAIESYFSEKYYCTAEVNYE